MPFAPALSGVLALSPILILLCLDTASGKMTSGGVWVKGNAVGAPVLSFGQASISPTAGSLMLQNSDSSVSLSPSLIQAQQVSVEGSASVGSVSAGGRSQWTLWDLDSFDATDSNAWSVNDHSFCGASSDFFLGGHCRFAATSTTRSYSNLPAHSKVKVTARIHYFDQWEGEAVAMSLDNTPVWSQSHHWCPEFLKWMCRKYGMDSCGRDEPDRLSVRAEAIIEHNAPTLTVGFASSLGHDKDPCYTSWGIDDVAVHVL